MQKGARSFEAAQQARQYSKAMVELDIADFGSIDQVAQSWRKDIPDLDVAAFSVQLKLYQINVLAGRIYGQIANDFSLTDIDVSVLMIIRRERPDRPVRPSDLWRSLQMGPSAMTYRLDRLHELGLVERLPDKNDRRALFLHLTEKGLKVVHEVVQRFNKITVECLARAVENGGSIAELDRQLDCYLKAVATTED